MDADRFDLWTRRRLAPALVGVVAIGALSAVGGAGDVAAKRKNKNKNKNKSKGKSKKCKGGTRRCGQNCVDPRSDPLHCGECYRACRIGTVCVNEACDCPNGEPPCGDTCCAEGQSCAGDQCIGA